MKKLKLTTDSKQYILVNFIEGGSKISLIPHYGQISILDLETLKISNVENDVVTSNFLKSFHSVQNSNHKLSYSGDYKITLGAAGGPPRAWSYVTIAKRAVKVQKEDTKQNEGLPIIQTGGPSPPELRKDPTPPISSGPSPIQPSSSTDPSPIQPSSSTDLGSIQPSSSTGPGPIKPSSTSRGSSLSGPSLSGPSPGGPSNPPDRFFSQIISPSSRFLRISRYELKYPEQMHQDNDSETLERIQYEIENYHNLEDARCAEITRDDKIVLIGFDDGIILRYDIEQARYLPHLKLHDSQVHAIQSLDDGKVISYEVNGIHKIWDHKTGNLIETIKGPTRDEMIILTFGEIPDEISFEYGIQDIIKTISYDQEGEYLFVGMHEGEIQQWKVRTSEDLEENWPRVIGGIGLRRVNSFQVISDDTILAGDFSGIIHELNLKTGKVINSFRVGKGRVNSIAYDSQYKLLCTSSEGKIIIWDYPEFNEKLKLTTDSKQYILVNFIEGGSKISLIPHYGQISILDLETLKISKVENDVVTSNFLKSFHSVQNSNHKFVGENSSLFYLDETSNNQEKNDLGMFFRKFPTNIKYSTNKY